ncbi:hypothetical protein [Corynebacterium provencense]|uniref:hypothetical protein n=1 Tax=Corynebacterium provencense TaxID=1737425 RepID=UPI000A808ECF|nr:hypothetical protein [Corynebacterium provencense]
MMINDTVATAPDTASVVSAVSGVASSVSSAVSGVISDLQHQVDALPPVLQFVAVFVLAVVPVIEGDIAAGIGMVAGVDWEFTFVAAAGGTALAAWAGALWGSRITERRRSRTLPRDDAGAAADTEDAVDVVPSRRRAAADRILARVDRYGLGPAMVLCGFVSPVGLNTFVLAMAGFDRRRLVVWGVVSAVLNVGIVVAGTTGVLHLLLH